MSAEAMTWAWQQDSVTGSDKLVLVAFAWKADPEGAVWIGPKTLGEMVPLDTRSLKRCVAKLADAGLIGRYRRQKRSGAEGSAFTILAMPRETPFPFENYEFVIGELIEGRSLPRSLTPVTPATPPPGQAGHPPVTQTSLLEETQTKGELRSPSPVLKIAGKPVNRHTWNRTVWALGEFNRQTGQNNGLLTGKGEPMENAKRIYLRLIQWPDLDERALTDIIRNTLNSRWWGDDKPSVGVVFGPRIWEENMNRKASVTSIWRGPKTVESALAEQDELERTMLAISASKSR